MNGRVVLIDFWATWCGPCKQELPHMKRLAQQYADQPFELISISWDSDEAKWKDFIAANGMTWNQYRDTDHSLSYAFGISAIPHYFTIHANGVLTAENLGSGANIVAASANSCNRRVRPHRPLPPVLFRKPGNETAMQICAFPPCLFSLGTGRRLPCQIHTLQVAST